MKLEEKKEFWNEVRRGWDYMVQNEVDDGKVIDARVLMHRWQIGAVELLERIKTGELRPTPHTLEMLDLYNSDGVMMGMTDVRFNSTNLLFVEEQLFPMVHVEDYEQRYPELMKAASCHATDLSGKERRELGQLRNEKETRNQAIEAAVHLALFCADSNSKITRKEADSELAKHNLYVGLPETTIRKIWKSIPAKHRNTGGRPKKG